MLLIIDNYDSFTYNLAQVFGAMGLETRVLRNDAYDLHDLASLAVDGVVISPGPGEPPGAGMSMDTIDYYKDRVPVLGICLGHQAICALFGGKVVRAPRLMHGKTSFVYHYGDPVFKETSSPFNVMRYHSLLVERSSLPAELEIIADTVEGDIMGVRHKRYPGVIGLQFHPESFFTPDGEQILMNYCRLLATPLTKPLLATPVKAQSREKMDLYWR